MNDTVDVEARLRRTYRAVADLTVVEPARGRLPDSGTRRIGLRVVAAIVVLLAAAAFATVDWQGSADVDSVATTPDSEGWELLPEAPIAAGYPGMVWTGTEMILFGGYETTPQTAVAAYDPAARLWRDLADLPAELAGADLGVWTGSQLVVLKSETVGVAGVYDAASDTWRVLEDPGIPRLNIESFVFWTGDRALIAGHPASGEDRYGGLGAGATLYDPVDDTWEQLPEAPWSLAASSDAVWTGREMIWVGWDAGVGGMTALALDPVARTWRALPAPPLSPRDVPVVAWTGSHLLVAGGLSAADPPYPLRHPILDAALFDPTTAMWSTFPAPPVGLLGTDIASRPVVAVLGGQVVAFISGDPNDPDGRPVVLDVTSRSWRFAPPSPHVLLSEYWHPVAVSTGSALFVWGTPDTPEDSAPVGYLFTPPPP